MSDAGPDATVSAIMGGAFGSAGGRCMVLSVVVAVGDETADKLIIRPKPLVEALKVGLDCMHDQKENEIGPVVSGIRQKKVFDYIDEGENEGVELMVDGRKLRMPGYDADYYVGGTLFDHITPEMTVWREGIFGPALGTVRTADYDSALELVNSHEPGSGSAVFTSNGHTARELIHDV